MVKSVAFLAAAWVAFALALFPVPAAAQSTAFSIAAKGQRAEGVDRVFDFEVTDATGHDLDVSGQVTFLDVYSASPAVAMSVPSMRVTPGKTDFSIRWSDAPLFGQMRALVVLNDGTDPLVIESFSYSAVPWNLIGAFAGAVIVALAIAFAFMRMPKRAGTAKKRGVPDHSGHVVEKDETVMNLAVRYDVNWQDLVSANHLKPPYTLKPGTRLIIPKHSLRHPPKEKQA
jgi:hypothetical protein